MLVGVHGEGGVGVAEAFADDLDRFAGGDGGEGSNTRGYWTDRSNTIGNRRDALGARASSGFGDRRGD